MNNNVLHLKCKYCGFVDMVFATKAKEWVCSNCYIQKMKEKDVPSLFAKRMQDMGKAEYLVKSILEDECFSCHFLSKHNEYWDSKHEPENDKLDEARRKFSYLQDKLWDIVNILEFPGED